MNEPVGAKLPTAEKSWNLEDDNDDEEEPEESVPPKKMPSINDQELMKRKQKDQIEEDEEDPLDAYMKEIYRKKRSNVQITMPKKLKTIEPSNKMETEENAVAPGTRNKVLVMTGVAKTVDPGLKKGAIMEQDLDGLEYNSDEEAAKNTLRDADSLESMAAQGIVKVKSKSEMVCTDHSKVYYRQFKKNFYVEVPEISRLTQQEVDKHRLELDDLKVFTLNVD